jgi:hypothetical protein
MRRPPPNAQRVLQGECIAVLALFRVQAPTLDQGVGEGAFVYFDAQPDQPGAPAAALIGLPDALALAQPTSAKNNQ